ncbi:MAG: hypothetical protein H0S79_17905 [Anaerolineaceae bacterium]|nr:hypothetical protein [Anaerolineaceae bacterium]
MEELWGLFWLGFILIPVLYLISRIFNKPNEDSQEKFSNAPGKAFADFLLRSWHESKQVLANIVFILLTIIFMGVIIITNQLDLKVSILIVATLICGGLVSFGYLISLYRIFAMTNRKNYDFIIPIGLGSISILILIFMLTLTLITMVSQKPMKFQINYLWIPVGLAPFGWMLRVLMEGIVPEKTPPKKAIYEQLLANPTKYPDTDPLSPWAVQMFNERKHFDGGRYIPENSSMYFEAAKRVQELVTNGYLGAGDFSEGFFYATERLLLAYLKGQPIKITIPGVSYAGAELFKTAKMVYLYIAQKNKNLTIHPEIYKALR